MKTESSKKGKLIAYWIITGVFALGMLFGGISQVYHAKWNAEGMIHLGLPTYLMTLLGMWKIFGTIVILIPRYSLQKEWAYAGFFFLMTGAVYSHLCAGDGIKGVISQSIFVILIVLSWYLRPANRKIEMKAAGV